MSIVAIHQSDELFAAPLAFLFGRFGCLLCRHDGAVDLHDLRASQVAANRHELIEIAGQERSRIARDQFKPVVATSGIFGSSACACDPPAFTMAADLNP